MRNLESYFINTLTREGLTSFHLSIIILSLSTNPCYSEKIREELEGYTKNRDLICLDLEDLLHYEPSGAAMVNIFQQYAARFAWVKGSFFLISLNYIIALILS